MANPKGCYTRKRRDCNRWELQVYDKSYGRFYGGLFESKEAAIREFGRYWNVKVRSGVKTEDVHAGVVNTTAGG